jgi:hypothetical protein
VALMNNIAILAAVLCSAMLLRIAMLLERILEEQKRHRAELDALHDTVKEIANR